MFTIIIEQLLPDLKNSDISDLISGNYDPALDKSDQRTRDREFELFIGGVARRAGMEVTLEEPDISLRHGGREWCIAAKRLSSSKRVRGNIDKAAKQILAARRPGFIFLDVTRILDPGYLVVTHWKLAQQTVGGPLLRFINTEHKHTLGNKRNAYVRGFVVHAAFPHVSQGFRYGTYETWWAVPVEAGGGDDVNSTLHGLLKGLRGS